MNEILDFYGQLLTPELRPVFLVAVFVFGSCVGSFLNVCIWRMPLRESVVFAPSHCTKCGAHIKWFDNIPLISYLILRGRCRSCRAPYSSRYFWIELFTGAFFLLLAVEAGGNHAVLPLEFAAAGVMIASGLIDAEHGIIPDKLTGFLFLFALLVPALSGDFREVAVVFCSGTGFFIALAVFALIGRKLAGKTALGWGDVKLLSAVAAVGGILPALYVTIAASLAGMVGGLVYAAIVHRKPAAVQVRFGSFIAVAELVWLASAKFLPDSAAMLNFF